MFTMCYHFSDNLFSVWHRNRTMDLPSDDLIFEDFARLRLRGQDSIVPPDEEASVSITDICIPLSESAYPSVFSATTSSSSSPN